MSLRAKIFLLLSVVALSYVSLEFGLQRLIIYRSFVALEKREAAKDMLRCVAAIEREVHHLDGLTNDWAAWDDTYAFVASLSPAYVEGNLPLPTFQNNRLSLVYYVDRKGGVVWGKIYDLSTGKEIRLTPFPEDALPPDHPMLALETEGRPLSEIARHGLLMTDRGPMLLAARPIIKSDNTGPARGTIIMGRFLDEELVATLSAQTRVAFNVRGVQPGELSAEETGILAAIVADGQVVTRRLPGSILRLHTIYPDLRGEPGLLIRADIPAEISAIGDAAFWWAMGWHLAFTVLILLLLATGFQREVVGPIRVLTAHTRYIIMSGDLSSSIRLRKRDEIGTLATTFNEMLSRLESGTAELSEVNDRLKGEVAGHKRTAEALREARDAAEAATRAKSRFLAHMSHEIRTPLNGIIGMAELMEETDLNGEQQQLSGIINAESESLLSIINDILDLSKIEAGMLELERIPFDLTRLFEDLACGMAVRAHQKNLAFVASLSPKIPRRLVGDPTRLRQILMNLSGNALKFTDEGEIFLAAELDEETGNRIRLRFQVTDTGIGISEEGLSTVFKSFAQADDSTSRKYGGTGLGITIAKQLAELMGGTIGASSEPGAGSTFWFTVVLEREVANAALSDPEERNRTLGFSGLQVMVVDGNRRSRRAICEYLRSLGCRPVGLSRVEEAVASVAQAAGEMTGEAPPHQTRFQLLVASHHPPQVDGFELVAKIRSVAPKAGLPVLLLASFGERGDGKRCRDMKIQGYLSQPIRRDELAGTIAQVLGREPVAQGSPPLPVTRHSASEDTSGVFRILLAEDYPANQQVAVRHLQRAGYRVDVADNGRRALALFSENRYDLVLMDIEMPEMDGYETTAAIRKAERRRSEGEAVNGKREVPIVAMTAHAVKHYIDRCFEEGMSDVLTKPLRREKLLGAVARWCSPQAGAPTAEGIRPLTSPFEKVTFPIDHAQALKEFEDDSEFLAEVLAGFLENVEGQIPLIRKALETNAADIIAKEAHAIRGGAANLTALELSGWAAELESLARTGDLQRAPQLLSELEAAFMRLSDFANTLGKTPAAAKASADKGDSKGAT